MTAVGPALSIHGICEVDLRSLTDSSVLRSSSPSEVALEFLMDVISESGSLASPPRRRQRSSGVSLN